MYPPRLLEKRIALCLTLVNGRPFPLFLIPPTVSYPPAHLIFPIIYNIPVFEFLISNMGKEPNFIILFLKSVINYVNSDVYSHQGKGRRFPLSFTGTALCNLVYRSVCCASPSLHDINIIFIFYLNKHFIRITNYIKVAVFLTICRPKVSVTSLISLINRFAFKIVKLLLTIVITIVTQ